MMITAEQLRQRRVKRAKKGYDRVRNKLHAVIYDLALYQLRYPVFHSDVGTVYQHFADGQGAAGMCHAISGGIDNFINNLLLRASADGVSRLPVVPPITSGELHTHPVDETGFLIMFEEFYMDFMRYAAKDKNGNAPRSSSAADTGFYLDALSTGHCMSYRSDKEKEVAYGTRVMFLTLLQLLIEENNPIVDEYLNTRLN